MRNSSSDAYRWTTLVPPSSSTTTKEHCYVWGQLPGQDEDLNDHGRLEEDAVKRVPPISGDGGGGGVGRVEQMPRTSSWTDSLPTTSDKLIPIAAPG